MIHVKLLVITNGSLREITLINLIHTEKLRIMLTTSQVNIDSAVLRSLKRHYLTFFLFFTDYVTIRNNPPLIQKTPTCKT